MTSKATEHDKLPKYLVLFCNASLVNIFNHSVAQENIQEKKIMVNKFTYTSRQHKAQDQGKPIGEDSQNEQH